MMTIEEINLIVKYLDRATLRGIQESAEFQNCLAVLEREAKALQETVAPDATEDKPAE